MKLAFDLFGGDSNINNAIAAVDEFCHLNPEIKLKIFIQKGFNYQNNFPNQIEVFESEHVIKHSDSFIEIRRKQDSTLVETIKATTSGDCDASISGGASGPLVATAYLESKKINSKVSPAFTTLHTGPDSKLRASLDIGASLEASPEDLLLFAKMGTVYTKTLGLSSNPKVALLNIGKESSKGGEIRTAAFKLLQEDPIVNFVGNLEANKILTGDYNVLVTDGLSGNMALKAVEGTLKMMKKIMKESTKSIFAKLGILMNPKLIKKMKIISNDNEIGGAIILGLNHIIIKAHGSSTQKQYLNAFNLTKRLVENKLITVLKETIKIDE